MPARTVLNMLRDNDDDGEGDFREFNNVSLKKTVPLIIGIIVVLTC